ncbi:MAG TPA: serine protease [Urbifossiella sp.]|nr:serine protease [Urbifossiella sp.]
MRRPTDGIARIVVVTPAGAERHVGTAIVVDDRHVMTCCHVVNDALGRNHRLDPARPPPGHRFAVRFPYADNTLRSGEVAEWGYARAVPKDVAVLQLDRPAPAAAGVAVFSADEVRGKPWACIGFDELGMPRDVTGEFAAVLPSEERQLNGKNGVAPHIAGGYSGAGVWADGPDAFVGMVTTVDRDQNLNGLAYAIPTAVLAEVWPRLRVGGAAQSAGREIANGRSSRRYLAIVALLAVAISAWLIFSRQLDQERHSRLTSLNRDTFSTLSRIDRKLLLEPNNPDPAWWDGVNADKLDEMILALEAAAPYRPWSWADPPWRESLLAYYGGVKAYLSGEPDKALEKIRGRVGVVDDNQGADLDLLRARCHIAQGSFAAGIQAIEPVLTRYPDSGTLQYLKGLCLHRLRRHHEADDAYAGAMTGGRRADATGDPRIERVVMIRARLGNLSDALDAGMAKAVAGPDTTTTLNEAKKRIAELNVVRIVQEAESQLVEIRRTSLKNPAATAFPRRLLANAYYEASYVVGFDDANQASFLARSVDLHRELGRDTYRYVEHPYILKYRAHAHLIKKDYLAALADLEEAAAFTEQLYQGKNLSDNDREELAKRHIEVGELIARPLLTGAITGNALSDQFRNRLKDAVPHFRRVVELVGANDSPPHVMREFRGRARAGLVVVYNELWVSYNGMIPLTTAAEAYLTALAHFHSANTIRSLARSAEADLAVIGGSHNNERACEHALREVRQLLGALRE